MAKLTEEQKAKRKATRERNLKLKEMERKKLAFEREVKDVINNYKLFQTKEPTRFFKVGDIVDSEYQKNLEILEVIDNCIYIVQGEKKEVKVWYDLLDPNVERNTCFGKRNIMKDIAFFQMHLSELINKHNYFGVNMDPDYQRNLVWELKDKELLIDSVFNSRNIGSFVFIKLDFKENSPSYEILDGKQRLSCIVDFTQDRFQYKGKFYSELSNNDKMFFRNHLVTIGESRGELTNEQKYEYFLNLNIAGREQSKEHLDYVRSLLKNH